MESLQPTLLSRYRYDPLGRLVVQTQPEYPARQRFYCKNRLATEIQGPVRYSIAQHGEQLLAQQKYQDDETAITLMTTNLQRSVLQTLNNNRQRQTIAYSAYGHRPQDLGLTSLLGFNGEVPDPLTGCYLLGNGYRAFSPVLMRFNSPDSWSPFGKGGLNTYGYCLGDPINKQDPDGHFPGLAGLQKGLQALDKKIFSALNSHSTPKNTTAPKQTIATAHLDLNSYNTLQNRHAGRLSRELREYKHLKKQQIQDPIKSVSNRRDLMTLKNNTSYKFVLTKEGQFITGAPVVPPPTSGRMGDLYMSHAVLGRYSGSSRIVSAGYLHIETFPDIMATNISGHYLPPKNTLRPVHTILDSMGAEIHEIRNQ